MQRNMSRQTKTPSTRVLQSESSVKLLICPLCVLPPLFDQIESGALGEGFLKGSDTHKAAVVGDTVGT